MRGAWLFAAIVASLVLQTLLAGLMVGSVLAVDLVLVVVVFTGLSSGRVSGLLAGTVAGLAQDALTSGILGIGGLAKSLAGFVAGVVGTQFIVTQAFPRFLVFFSTTVLHAVVFMGLYTVLGLRHYGSVSSSVLLQALGNALLGVLLFQVTEFMPGFAARRAARRWRTRSTRRWAGR
jgi:rod shape-determining protein MreD